MPVVQDGPPPGGFPSVRIARRIPSTGPGGFTVFAVSSAIMAYGFYLVSVGQGQCCMAGRWIVAYVMLRMRDRYVMPLTWLGVWMT